MTSAVRVGGRRLHSLARQGIEIERAPRRVTIHGLDVLEMGESHLVLDVRCSKGTYVRTLAADLGQALGTVAHLEELRRTHVGILSVDGAFPAAELAGTTVDELVERASLSAAAALGAWPAVKLGAEDDARVRHGMLPVQSPSSDRKAGERVRLLSETAGLLALAEVVTIPDHAAPSWRLLRVLEAPDPVEP
jgi:tRNA pseudouridine55 synthase